MRIYADTSFLVSYLYYADTGHAAARALFAQHAADVLHVALLDQLRPDLFVTRDQDQFTLAQTTGWPALFVR